MKHWSVRVEGKYLFVQSDTLHRGGLSFGEKREVVKELKCIEGMIKNDKKLFGWVGYTWLHFPNVMKLFRKIGAMPYEINVGEELIWFRKEIENVP